MFGLVNAKLRVPLGDFQREGIRKLSNELLNHQPGTPERGQCLDLLLSHVHHPSAAVTDEACLAVTTLVASGELERSKAYAGLLGAASVQALSGSAVRIVVAAVTTLLLAEAKEGNEGDRRSSSTKYSLQCESHPLSALLASRPDHW